VRLDELKGVASLVHSQGAEGQDALAFADEEEGLKGLAGDELIRRQELNELYADVKERLEHLNVTLETIVYTELKYTTTALATAKGLQQVFERLEIVLTKTQAERVLNDVRAANHGESGCSFKNFIDFMTRKRINVAFVDKGFIDPLIAQCCQQLAKAKEPAGLTFEQLFGVFEGTGGHGAPGRQADRDDRDYRADRSDKVNRAVDKAAASQGPPGSFGGRSSAARGPTRGLLSKENFLVCAQGLELDIACEDLMEFFNYMDDKRTNTVSKVQFVDALTYVTSKLGGQSFLEAQMNRGLSQAKKGTTNRQSILKILNNVADSIQKK